MKLRNHLLITTCAFLIPLALLSINASWSHSFPANLSDINLLMMNWLFMCAPHFLVVCIALILRAARLRFLPWSLIALSVALVAFQCWIWFWVPPRESGLAWILYLPVSAIVLASVAGITLLRQRFNRVSKQTAIS